MLKKEAAEQFNESVIRPHLTKCLANDESVDSVMIHTEWSYYKDSLHRDGQITDHQAHIWMCPKIPKLPRIN